ncbi:unnamed protein product [Clonostachys byssicola]|uniref:Uncharacterized protein n=1 Tax=Clonostachys byssicola TaxID=160290 RepID=A0A9N9UP64_9HYPO|nr:unnamed protein product [Clonostachys byssicola]
MAIEAKEATKIAVVAAAGGDVTGAHDLPEEIALDPGIAVGHTPGNVKATTIGWQLGPTSIHTDGMDGVTPRNRHGANRVIIPARTRCLPRLPHHHRRALARHIGAMEDVGMIVAGLTVASLAASSLTVAGLTVMNLTVMDLTIAGRTVASLAVAGLTITSLTVANLAREIEPSRQTATSPAGVDQDRQFPAIQGTQSVTNTRSSVGTRPSLRATQVPRTFIYEERYVDRASSLEPPPQSVVSAVQRDPETGQPSVNLVTSESLDWDAIARYLQSLCGGAKIRVSFQAVHERRNKNDPKSLVPPWECEEWVGPSSIIPPPPEYRGNSGKEIDTNESANAPRAQGNAPKAKRTPPEYK